MVAYSARDASRLRAGLGEPRVGSMPVEYATPRAEGRPVELLAAGRSRAAPRAVDPGPADQGIAESAGLVLLHDDKDFELIAEVSGQRLERV